MANRYIWHTTHGRLDIGMPDLGRPDLKGLWERLLEDRRQPLPSRQLQCGGICREQGYTEWMHVYERQGRRVAAHQTTTAEKRHEARESDEHKAYKERTVRVAEEAGFRAQTEVTTSDGRVRSDVLIHGATALPTSFEIQRSLESSASIRKRNKAALRHDIAAAWHTDRRDMFDRNEVAWTRTDNGLHSRAIRDGKDLQIRGGFRRLEMERCDERRARPCPVKRTGRCGKWHPHSTPAEIPYDEFVRRVAADEFVQVRVKEFRTHFRFWTTSEARDRLHDNLEEPQDREPIRNRRASTSSDSAPTCTTRHRDNQLDPQPHSTALTITPPTLRPVRRGECDAGVSPCGAQARLYAGGWRCQTHAP